MFFNHPEELKKKIKSLVEKQLQTKEGEKCAELKEISKLLNTLLQSAKPYPLNVITHTKQEMVLGKVLKNTWKQKRTWIGFAPKQKQKKGVIFMV